MDGKTFTTLEDWTKFMHGKHVIIIRESHPQYKERCKFVEMVGNENRINHPANLDGKAIAMKVKRFGAGYLLLQPGDFFVEEKLTIVTPVKDIKIINGARRPMTGLGGNLLN